MICTITDDGLNVFVPDEEMIEMFHLINKSPYTSGLKFKLLNEIERLIPYPELQRLKQ